ncbi:hypothetical protein E4634_10460 [Mangrovimicrobium sediminis]|uniref:Choice-of-anchor D domain-containing protein n=1 Tax=Mangrovimicrobium sediminis TaxID=2562682 RepID=A0A4Z0M249_9GAMM|nr:hypothetical protein [Haliea sp. SAOS-164]TGD73448.1 hypothetical protein E4634_10460 [Haliea sp. SAOS-164]
MRKRLITACGLFLASSAAMADIELVLTPPAIDYGTLAVGNSVTENASIGITFDGNGALDGNANNGSVTSISLINVSGSGLSVSQACAGTTFSAASPGDTCAVEVTCAPLAAGSATGQLEVEFTLDNGASPDVATVDLSCDAVEYVSPPPDPNAIPVMGVVGLGILGSLLGALAAVGLGRKRR